MTIQDPRFAQFTFGTASISALPQDKLMKGLEKNDELFEILYPVFIATGFLEKTKFRSLYLLFWLVPEHYIEHEISFEDHKRDKSLWIRMNLHQSKALEMFERNYVQYILTNAVDMLAAACENYNLNEQALDALRERFSLCKTVVLNKARRTVDVNRQDELRVHIKLRENEMGDMDQFLVNTNIMESADQLLNMQNVGRFDASEIGMGFETIFFVGPSAQKMYAALKPILSKLPSGSYAELVNPQGSKRTDL